MNLSKLLPMAMMGGVAYTQQDSIEVIMSAPLEAAKVVRCRMEIGGIQRIILINTLTDEVDRSLERRFPEFLRKNLISTGDRDVSLDPWGNPYRVKIHPDEVEIWSYGPDAYDDTSDDIWAVVPLK